MHLFKKQNSLLSPYYLKTDVVKDIPASYKCFLAEVPKTLDWLTS